jgi:hypothetical protein
VGEAVAAAQRERALSKQALEARIGTLEGRVREELDWRTKLRQDGVRYAAAGVVVVVVVAGVVARRRHRSKKESPVVDVTTLDDVAEQLRSIRMELAKRRKENGPLWRALALRAAAAAAAAGGTMAAKQAMDRFSGPVDGRGAHGVRRTEES